MAGDDPAELPSAEELLARARRIHAAARAAALAILTHGFALERKRLDAQFATLDQRLEAEAVALRNARQQEAEVSQAADTCASSSRVGQIPSPEEVIGVYSLDTMEDGRTISLWLDLSDGCIAASSFELGGPLGQQQGPRVIADPDIDSGQ